MLLVEGYAYVLAVTGFAVRCLGVLRVCGRYLIRFRVRGFSRVCGRFLCGFRVVIFTVIIVIRLGHVKEKRNFAGLSARQAEAIFSFSETQCPQSW
jgi:hypothetical protein